MLKHIKFTDINSVKMSEFCYNYTNVHLEENPGYCNSFEGSIK